MKTVTAVRIKAFLIGMAIASAFWLPVVGSLHEKNRQLLVKEAIAGIDKVRYEGEINRLQDVLHQERTRRVW